MKPIDPQISITASIIHDFGVAAIYTEYTLPYCLCLSIRSDVTTHDMDGIWVCVWYTT